MTWMLFFFECAFLLRFKRDLTYENTNTYQYTSLYIRQEAHTKPNELHPIHFGSSRNRTLLSLAELVGVSTHLVEIRMSNVSREQVN